MLKFIVPRFAFSLFAIMLVPAYALAQAATLPVISDLTNEQALAELFKSIGGLQGASIMSIIVVCVQAIMLFFRSPLASFAGKWKLLIVCGLSLISTFIGLVASGVDWKAALLHGTTLGSLQVLANQIYVHSVKPSDAAGKA